MGIHPCKARFKTCLQTEKTQHLRGAAERAADDARKLADRAKTLRDAHGWGVEIRRSKIRAELARGANPIIDATIAGIPGIGKPRACRAAISAP